MGPTPFGPATTVPSFTQLFTGTVGDFKKLPTKQNMMWLGVGAAAAALAHTQDVQVSRAMSSSTALDRPLDPGATVGGLPFQLGSAMATYALGRMTNHPKLAAVGADLVQAQLVAQTLSWGIKYAAQRTRPDGTAYSFPSGHTAVSFASATVLQRHYGWKTGIPAYAIASAIAASRIQDKRHYLSDVTFGAAIGLVAGRTVTVGTGSARFAVGPTVTEGGGGVGFTWVGKK